MYLILLIQYNVFLLPVNDLSFFLRLCCWNLEQIFLHLRNTLTYGSDEVVSLQVLFSVGNCS